MRDTLVRVGVSCTHYIRRSVRIMVTRPAGICPRRGGPVQQQFSYKIYEIFVRNSGFGHRPLVEPHYRGARWITRRKVYVFYRAGIVYCIFISQTIRVRPRCIYTTPRFVSAALISEKKKNKKTIAFTGPRIVFSVQLNDRYRCKYVSPLTRFELQRSKESVYDYTTRVIYALYRVRKIRQMARCYDDFFKVVDPRWYFGWSCF